MDKALIAMSGGVDSSVAAFLMIRSGFGCIGATMRLWENEHARDSIGDAKSIARRLGMDFHVIDYTQDFREKVVDAFIHSYEIGDTPNPCIRCNRHLKFDALLHDAIKLGCQYLATGHYAKVCYDPGSGRHLLYKATDATKDQSYFLSSLTQEQLSHTKFPLGELTKEQVRQIAGEQGFLNARKKDSQDICFIPDGDYMEFITRYTGKSYPSGRFLDQEGNTVGQHCGAVRYTIGQRKGLGLAMGEPVYVCSKDMESNTVTVGPDAALYKSALIAKDWNGIAIPAVTNPLRVSAKIRYRHTPQPATVFPEEGGNVRIVFDQPQRAITPGQAVVLYDNDLVIGSGTITSAY